MDEDHKWLKKQRKILGYTQKRMAEELGISKSAYVALELGISGMRKVYVLAIKYLLSV